MCRDVLLCDECHEKALQELETTDERTHREKNSPHTGHASLQMTLRYSHLSDKHLAEKMEALAEAMSGSLGPDNAGIAPLIAPPAHTPAQI